MLKASGGLDNSSEQSRSVQGLDNCQLLFLSLRPRVCNTHMFHCSSTCSSSNETAIRTADIQAAMQVHDLNIKRALDRIAASNNALQILLGPTLRAELLTLKFALESLQAARESQEMLAFATTPQ